MCSQNATPRHAVPLSVGDIRGPHNTLELLIATRNSPRNSPLDEQDGVLVMDASASLYT